MRGTLLAALMRRAPAFGLIERGVPESTLTEGVTWVITGIGFGMTLGALVSGWAVDSFGPAYGFWASVVASVTSVVIVALGQAGLSGGRTADAASLRQPAE